MLTNFVAEIVRLLWQCYNYYCNSCSRLLLLVEEEVVSYWNGENTHLLLCL